MGPARTASPNADQIATGRRPTASDSRPSTHAAPAVTANVAAVIDNVATRSSFLVAARWFGMKTKNVLKAREPAAIRAKPRNMAGRSLAHKVGIGCLIRCPDC